MGALRFLLVKELNQLKGNRFLNKLVILFPLMVMLILPWIATFDVKEIKLSVVDKDRSSLSSDLVKKIKASNYFIISSYLTNYESALEDVENGDADIILEIPKDFEINYINGKVSEVYIAANGVNSTKGTIGSGYLASIVSDFKEYNSPLDMVVRFKYNPTLNYHHFMVPALMILLIILLCGFLPALNIVSEKESGTIEQMNVTPVSKMVFILSKLIFYGSLGFFVFTFAFIIAYFVYGVTPNGGLFVIYVAAIIFIIIISGFGLIISNLSNTMQQSVFFMFFFMMFFMMMTGFFTPIISMPMWAQSITYLLPPRYFIEIMRSVCLKGSGFTDLWFEFVMLAVLAIVVNAIAIATYKKQS